MYGGLKGKCLHVYNLIFEQFGPQLEICLEKLLNLYDMEAY